jgi:hypothetical protein
VPEEQAAAQNLQMAWLSQHSMLWQCLPWEPRVVAAVDRLLGAAGDIEGVEVHYDQSFLKPARVGAGTAWHTAGLLTQGVPGVRSSSTP